MVHPVKRYLAKQFPAEDGGVDYKAASQRCEQLGFKASAEYLKQFAEGYYCPSIRFCALVSSKLCDGKVSLKKIAAFEYTLRPCTWGAAA